MVHLSVRKSIKFEILILGWIKLKQMLIKRAEIEDIGDVQLLYHDAYCDNVKLGFPAEAAFVSYDNVKGWIINTNVYIAIIKDSIVGTFRLKLDHEMNLIVLSRLAVASIYKGNGIASRLINCAEEKVTSIGYNKIALTTPLTHPFLPDMYEKRGYKKTKIITLNHLPYDEVLMIKCLNKSC